MGSCGLRSLARGDEATAAGEKSGFRIAHARDDRGGEGSALWEDQDGFYYDVLHLPDGDHHFLKVRSMVGLIPLFAVETLEPEIVDRLPGFKRRMQWFIDNRPEFREHMHMTEKAGAGTRHLLAIVNRDRLRSLLRYMMDEAEFLSPYGVRALSRSYREEPYVLSVNRMEHRVDYEPGESSTGSGQTATLWEVAAELSRRLIRAFERDAAGRRPVYGSLEKFQNDPHWRDYIQFHEYFHGDTGFGIGASHQTGWTALVAKLIEQSGR